MMKKLEKQLLEAQSALLAVERSKRKQVDVIKTYEQKLEQQKEAYERLKKENKDVDKIVGVSIASFVATILNNREEKIDKENYEALEAKRSYDQISYEIETLSSELEDLKSVLMEESKIKERYNTLFDEKRNLLLTENPEIQRKMVSLENDMKRCEAELKEVNEALVAANLVSATTQSALSELQSAKNLGVFDMMGGGTLVTLAKRSRMNAAQQLINRLNSDLQRFSSELKDVDKYTTSHIEVANYLQLGDWLFDGLFMDIFVQNKIKETMDRVSKVNRDIAKVKRHLTEMKNSKMADKQALSVQMEQLIITV